MPGRHAILGPSSAYRWITCTPSARFEEQLPNEETTYAAEGTLAHDLAALILSSRAGIFRGNQAKFNGMLNAIEAQVIAFYESIGSDNGKAEFHEMLDYAEAWAAYVRSHADGTQEAEILIEHEYDLSEYIPVGFGTADATVRTRKVLYGDDYKYGAGVVVSAKDNYQLMIYGLGAYLEAVADGWTEIEVLVLSIFQPRAGGLEPVPFEITVDDLLHWAETILRPAALLAIAGAGDFVPGKHCQFCRARTSCKAYYDRFAELRKIHDRRQMSARELSIVLAFGGMIKSWVGKVEEEAIRKLQTGHKVPGYKLVNGRNTRKFKNEDDVVEILLAEDFETEQIFKSELRALTDLEKQVGPKRFAELFASLIINTPGKPQIADEDDERPAIGLSAADDYDDEENDLL